MWFHKISIPAHGGSLNFLGVGGSKRDKIPKGRGLHKEFFFPEGLQCNRINTIRIFPIDSGNQEKRKVILSVEIDVGFLVIYFLLLFRRQTTHTALRHTSEYHVRPWVKQNVREEKYRPQSPNIGRIEWTYRECIAERSSNMMKMTICCTFYILKIALFLALTQLVLFQMALSVQSVDSRSFILPLLM